MRIRQAALSLLVIGGSCSSDLVRETYPNVEAARAAGLFARGWVPDVLPDGSGPIVEVHDLDTNQHCSRSEVSASAVSDVMTALVTEGFSPHSGEAPGPPLSACPFGSSEAGRAASLFRRTASVSPGAEFAVVFVSGTVHVWSH